VPDEYLRKGTKKMNHHYIRDYVLGDWRRRGAMDEKKSFLPKCGSREASV